MTSAGSAVAQGEPGRRWLSRRRRWREVREAVRRGEIEPLRRLMRHFEAETGYEIIDIRYRRAGGDHLYGFKVFADGGRLRWYVINAATREIMTLEDARSRYRR